MESEGTSARATGLSLPQFLDLARISSLPDSAYYIADFLSEDEERLILDKVRRSKPLPVALHLAEY
jgi:alkylated DNA repair protein alkB family protein 6